MTFLSVLLVLPPGLQHLWSAGLSPFHCAVSGSPYSHDATFTSHHMSEVKTSRKPKASFWDLNQDPHDEIYS
ncbi:hypothetical protein HOLleu_30924 [Holothuria leucospilota]|uniref:Uncharacterized protein n=1 Tax=Holothuria leucospilota TaxID=206669 RepID=A0A9Q1BLA2_HOLLE|nr:hypothetical protein HOLleu_30924 [Holothuria leucospilota]